MMREPTFKAFAKPGASEVDVAEAADALAQAVIPSLKRMVEGLLMLQIRHMFEGEGITAAERATGRLPGSRQVAVAFADLAGFTRLGEMLPPEDLQRVAGRLGELAHDIAVPPVSFVKTIGDAVMFVSTDTDRLIAALLDLIDLAAAHDLPQLRGGDGARRQPCRGLVRQPGQHRQPRHRTRTRWHSRGYGFCTQDSRYSRGTCVVAGRGATSARRAWPCAAVSRVPRVRSELTVTRPSR